MTQPKRSTSRSTSSRSSSRSTKSTGGTRRRSTGTRSTASSAESTSARASQTGEANVEAAAERIRALNERILDGGKQMGLATLQVYESALTAIADTLKRGPGSSDVDVIARIATAQADLLRELTKSWSAAARRALK